MSSLDLLVNSNYPLCHTLLRGAESLNRHIKHNPGHDSGMIESLKSQLTELSSAVQKQDTATGQRLLQSLKMELLTLDSLPPMNLSKGSLLLVYRPNACLLTDRSPTAEEERAVAREVYEYAVLLAIQSGDRESFQRYLANLRPYYTGYR